MAWTVFQPGNIKFLESDAFVSGFSQGQRDAVALEDALRRWRKDDQSFDQKSIENKQNNTLRGQRIEGNNIALGEANATATAKQLDSPQGKAVFSSIRAEAAKRGYANPDAVATAISAAAWSESRFNSGAVNPNDVGKESIGLIQWRAERNNALRNFAKSSGKDWRDLGTQVTFMFNELDGNEKTSGNRLRSAQDPNSASQAAFGFIRFKGYDDPNDAQYRGRMGNAAVIAKLATNNGWSNAPIAQAGTQQSAAANTAPANPVAPDEDPFVGADGTPKPVPLPPPRPSEFGTTPINPTDPAAAEERNQIIPGSTPYSRGLTRALKRAQAENPVERYTFSDPVADELYREYTFKNNAPPVSGYDDPADE